MAGYSGTPLVQKIGIKPGDRLLLLNSPKHFDKELAPMPPEVELASPSSKEKPLNVALCFTANRKELERVLPAVKPKLAQNGMVWVGWPKKSSGVVSDLDENIIRDTGLALGLVDVKVCAINDTWSGLKFVIPVKDRKPK
jgi:hypothetical protein